MITIRPAIIPDAKLLYQLGRQTFAETFTHYAPGEVEPFLDEHYSEAAFAEELSDATSRFWIAESDHGAIAYAKLGTMKLPIPFPENSFELHKLYVQADWKGKQIGSQLMTAILAEAATLKARHLYLGVWEKNLAAQQFYQRFGFMKVAEYNYPPIGNTIDREWILHKSL